MSLRERVNKSLAQFLNAILRNWSIRLTLIAILGGFGLGILAIIVVGVEPGPALEAMVRGAFGSDFARENTAAKITPILLTGLAVVVAFRAGLFNIGGEGQLLAGAAAGGATGLYLPDGIPGPIRVPLMLLAAALAGGIWGGIPGVLRAYFGLNEILTSLLLNAIALYILGYLVSGPMEDTNARTIGYPWTPPLDEQSRLPVLPIGTGITSGLVMALTMTAIVWLVLNHHRVGQDWRAIGVSPPAATFAGVPSRRRIVGAMVASGALAGLAGIAQLAGAQYRLTNFFSQGYGFDGIVVAIVGGLRAWGTAFAAFAFGALRTGAESMERTAAVPSSIALIMQGFILVFLVIAFSTKALRFRERRESAAR